MTCRHCRKEKRKLRARGLCWLCYSRPEVRRLYPSNEVYVRTGEPTADELDALIAAQRATMPEGEAKLRKPR